MAHSHGPWRGRLFALATGTAAAVLLLELALRVVGAMHAAETGWHDDDLTRPADADAVVLCVGDSWTEGVGAAAGAGYPGQLQSRFDAQRPGVAVELHHELVEERGVERQPETVQVADSAA